MEFAGPNTLKTFLKKCDERYVNGSDSESYTIKKSDTGADSVATYQLYKGDTPVGDLINIPKDYLVRSCEVKIVTQADDPVAGYAVGDKYIDFVINSKDDTDNESHIYLLVAELASTYTSGDGITISPTNTVSVNLDPDKSNGLSISTAGLSLDLATQTNSGAMSSEDKTKLDSIQFTEKTDTDTTYNTEIKLDASSGKLYSDDGVGKRTARGGEIFNDYVSNRAEQQYSHAEGQGSLALAVASHAEGRSNTVTNTGSYAHAEGYLVTASGYSSHAEGRSTTSSGEASHAEGYYGQARAHSSHAEGYRTIASGGASHAEGNYTTTEGNYSHAEGSHTLAPYETCHVEGRYNDPLTSDGVNYLHMVGNGTAEDALSNAHTLDEEGVAWYAKSVKVGGTKPSEGQELSTIAYVNQEIANHSHNNYYSKTDDVEKTAITLTDSESLAITSGGGAYQVIGGKLLDISIAATVTPASTSATVELATISLPGTLTRQSFIGFDITNNKFLQGSISDTGTISVKFSSTEQQTVIIHDIFIIQ